MCIDTYISIYIYTYILICLSLYIYTYIRECRTSDCILSSLFLICIIHLSLPSFSLLPWVFDNVRENLSFHLFLSSFSLFPVSYLSLSSLPVFLLLLSLSSSVFLYLMLLSFFLHSIVVKFLTSICCCDNNTRRKETIKYLYCCDLSFLHILFVFFPPLFLSLSPSLFLLSNNFSLTHSRTFTIPFALVVSSSPSLPLSFSQ